MAKKRRKTAVMVTRAEPSAEPWSNRLAEAPTQPSADQVADAEDVVGSVDDLRGYISDGRFVEDMRRLLPDDFLDADDFSSEREAFAKDIEHLPDEIRSQLMAIWNIGAAGELREVTLNWSLGYRLTEFPREELIENFDGQEWMVDLALQSVEVLHDGGLAHFHACPDGVRVWCNEWYWEEDLVCDSIDVLAWLAVHQAAVDHGTYAAASYAASLQNVGVTSRDFVRSK